MKVTLWQQFSSNHSADFMIVGEFESVEWAEMVVKELSNMLLDIAVWRNTFDAQFSDVTDYYRAWDNHPFPTPPELKFKEQYDLRRWAKSREGERLDWFLQNPKDVLMAVRRFEHYVILDKHRIDAAETWNGPYPFDEIMRQLGGKVVVDCGGLFDFYLAVNIKCGVPDQITLESILKDAPEPQRRSDWRQLGSLKKTHFDIFAKNQTLEIQNYAMRSTYPTYKGTKNGNPEFEYHYFEEELQRLLNYLKAHGCTDIQYEFIEVPYRKADG